MGVAIEGAVKCLKHWLSQAVAFFHSAPLAPCDCGGGAVELLPSLPQLPPLTMICLILSQLITGGITKESLWVKSCNLTAIGHKILTLFHTYHFHVRHISCRSESSNKS